MQRLTSFLISLCFCIVTYGQDARQVQPDWDAGANGQTPYIIHVTDLLMARPEGQEALRTFHERKAAGLLTTREYRPAKTGEIRIFKVANLNTEEYDEIEFESKGDTLHDPAQSGFRLWVETAELANGNVTDADIATLITALAEKTPPNSFSPGTGVVGNMERIFGEPPNFDGDDISDMLLLDIRDQYDGENYFGFVAGFVNPADLGSPVGNGADIVYLDTWPQLTSYGADFVAQTGAHEYQHLIMNNYDRGELTFINEGLSEWSEIALGYPGRPMTYLDTPKNYNVSLYRWNRDEPYDDYQRAGLFMTYFGNRFGVLESGHVTRQPGSGSAGLAGALNEIAAGVTVSDLIYDFHVANYFNDVSRGPAFGYTSPDHLTIKAAPREIIAGSAATSSPTKTVSIAPGGVAYVEWREVNDLKVAVQRESTAQQEVQARVIRYDEVGQYSEMQEVPVSGDTLMVEGESSRAVLIIAGLNPDSSPANVDYGAAWSLSQAQAEIVYVQYDDGYAVGRTGSGRDNAFFSMQSGEDAVIATRFVPHTDASDNRLIYLDRVWVAPYWFSQFSNTGVATDAPRDFILYVWSARNNQPDTVLFQKEFADLSTAGASYALTHLELDLSAEAQMIGELPDTVFIGIGEAGTDPNRLVVGPSAYDGDDISFIGDKSASGGAWIPLWDIRFASGDTTATDNTVIPTRAQFILTEHPADVTGAVHLAGLPDGIKLEQNYPNPFNLSTTISFELPEPVHVRLNVFDAMGRQVVTLKERFEPAGRHKVYFRANSLASGVYFYRLDAGAASLTKRMLLIK